MFQPASLKGASPTPIDERIRKKYLILYYTLIVLSFLPLAFFQYIYIRLFWTQERLVLFFLLFPFNVFFSMYLLQFCALFISALVLILVKLIHPPREGQFSRDPQDKDYFYWNLRNLIKKWPLFLSASNPFPWAKNRFMLRILGTKIGKDCICDNGWISSELVSIGKNVILGMGSTVLTFGIEQEKFLLKRIIIEDNAVIGAKCVLLPGTHIKKGAKLSAHSYTAYNATLEEGGLYMGHPAELKEE